MSSIPGLRKKLSPIVVDESAATVRARFSNVNRLRSGVQVITGGASTNGPGVMSKSTLLSWKPRPDTGAAYHQLRSKVFQLGWVNVGSKYEPSPTTLPVTRRSPRARNDSAIASTTFHVARSKGGWSSSAVRRCCSDPRSGVVRGRGEEGVCACSDKTPLIVSDARISFRIEHVGEKVHEHKDHRQKENAALDGR